MRKPNMNLQLLDRELRISWETVLVNAGDLNEVPRIVASALVPRSGGMRIEILLTRAQAKRLAGMLATFLRLDAAGQETIEPGTEGSAARGV